MDKHSIKCCRRSQAPRHAGCFLVTAALFLSTVMPGTPVSYAQEATEDTHAKPTENEPLATAELSDQQQEMVRSAIEELASDEFATRERAATRLSELGRIVLPTLRETAKSSDDPEVRLRAAEIARKMSGGDMKARLEDFLSGKDVPMQGWRIVRALMGDSFRVRELFVGLVTDYPSLIESMEKTPRDRAIASEAVLTSIQNKMFVQREFPNRVDTFAILLAPAMGNRLPVNASYESVLLSVLKKSAANKIIKDAQLSRPFKLLLNRWVSRSTLTSRLDVLRLGMTWSLDSTLPLAIQTLTEAKQTETLTIAMQAISRFGDAQHVEFVQPLIADDRPLAEQGFLGDGVQTVVGDIAMVTIAFLYEVPTKDVGLGEIAHHPVFGFLLTDIAFPDDDDNKARKAARKKIEQKIERMTNVQKVE